jgi:hypothetical protein
LLGFLIRVSGQLSCLLSPLLSHISSLACLGRFLPGKVRLLICCHCYGPNHSEIVVRYTPGKKCSTCQDDDRRDSCNCIHLFCSTGQFNYVNHGTEHL